MVRSLRWMILDWNWRRSRMVWWSIWWFRHWRWSRILIQVWRLYKILGTSYLDISKVLQCCDTQHYNTDTVTLRKIRNFFFNTWISEGLSTWNPSLGSTYYEKGAGHLKFSVGICCIENWQIFKKIIIIFLNNNYIFGSPKIQFF